MTLPKNGKNQKMRFPALKIAVDQAGIQAIHPDKLESFAEYLVQQAREQQESNSNFYTYLCMVCTGNYK